MCLEWLLESYPGWSHYMNLAGSELPNRPFASFALAAEKVKDVERTQLVESYRPTTIFLPWVVFYWELRRQEKMGGGDAICL